MSFPIKAECIVGPNGKPCGGGSDEASGNVCQGLVVFTQQDADTCLIEWNLKGCGAEGPHGFHIHEKADFSNGCVSAGPHYNPMGKDHGAPSDENRHAGDLGNVMVDKVGNSKGQIEDRMVKLMGETSVIGRSVMVHADPDDCGKGDHSEPGVNGKTSLTTGNAGARIACGEIKLC